MVFIGTVGAIKKRYIFANMDSLKQLLRDLPKVDEAMSALQTEQKEEVPSTILKKVVQKVIEEERQRLLQGESPRFTNQDKWMQGYSAGLRKELEPKLKRVINGTGVVIHTNLGRSLLSTKTTKSLMNAGGYYSNLELDLNTGKRGSRYSLVEEMICELTGAEAALVVNNNAAAVLIALETLAKGREVIVSRGQLVEIGGSFRIPDVMTKSGAHLVEVGATNRTHLYDYERAIGENTAMLLRVHTSNFRIIGFTSDVDAEELVALARANGLLTMEDLGSGCLVDLSPFGFPKEPMVQEVVRAGVDVVTFSGDKLLGGPQAGIIVGRREIIDRIKRNPLNRALRIDKFTLAGLEGVLREYYDPLGAMHKVPTLQMLTVAQETIKKRARKLQRLVKNQLGESCGVTIIATTSRVGGGALPEVNLPSYGLHLMPTKMTPNGFDQLLRTQPLPILGRIEDDRYILDVRTIQDHELPEVVHTLASVLRPKS